MRPLFLLVSWALFASACHGPEAAAKTPPMSAAVTPMPALAMCPVCHMTVRIESNTPHTVYLGRTYYFDDADMLPLFEKAPMKYLNPDLTINTARPPEGH